MRTPTKILTPNREWLRILLDYVYGEYVVTIEVNSPLPKWDETLAPLGAASIAHVAGAFFPMRSERSANERNRWTVLHLLHTPLA